MGFLTSTPTREPGPYDSAANVFANEFRALLSADQSRIKRMADYRKELESSRESDLNAAAGYYGRVNTSTDTVARHKFKLPFGQSLTVKHSFRIAGRLPDALVDVREETPEERHRSDTMEKVWWSSVRDSDGEVQLSDAAWDGSQLGACVLEPYFDLASNKVLFRTVDPCGVIVVRGVQDPHKYQRYYRFWQAPLASILAEYRDRSVAGQPIDLNRIQQDPNGVVTMVQMKDSKQCIRFALGQPGVDGLANAVDVPVYHEQHDYGFTPVVIIPNLGPQRNVWGWSDYDFVREAIAYLCDLFGREADILRAVAAGAYKAKGSKLSPAVAARILRNGGVLPVGREGDLEPVQAAEIPSFAGDHADRALTFFEMLGFAPKAAWGDGNAGSGSDRGLQLGPMLELTAMKQLNFSAGLSRLAEMIYKITESKAVEAGRYSGVAKRGAKRTSFTFKFGPGADPLQSTAPDGSPVELPMTPKEVFDGDYTIRFSWPSRLDPDDPAFVASELNKFREGVQSARTTLEKFGVEAPEDELKLIEQENEDHPWLRQGMLKLLEMQFGASQQGQNDGSQNQAAQPFSGATQTMTSKDGKALDGDAMSKALGGVGVLHGGA